MTDTPPPTVSSGSPDPADVEKNKMMAILAYIGILVLVPIFAAKDSKFARYHANQGLLLFILAVACSIVLMILFAIAFVVPFLPCVVSILWLLFVIGMLVMSIMGIINAANGKMKPLPVIGTMFTILK
jgi:uncharacterized membrane protein